MLHTHHIKPGPRPVTDPNYACAETGILTPFVSYRVTEGDDSILKEPPAVMTCLTA